MARPVEKDAADIERLIDEYFDICAESDEFPDEAGMWIYLAILPRERERYSNKPGVQDLLDMAKQRRESWLVRRMAKDNKAATGCMNALKQEKNGGYVDKSAPNTNIEARKLTIKMEGVGKKAFG